MRKLVFTAMAFAAIIIAGCKQKKQTVPADTTTDTIIVSDSTEVEDSVVNKFTDFTMNDTEGNPVNIMDEIAKNNVTVIDFWASWCGPCRQEMPTLVKLYAEEKTNGLGIVGISLDNDLSNWKSAIEKDNITWIQLSDLQGWENAAARMYNVNAIPHTIIVNREGNIVAEGLRGEELTDFIKNYLK